MILKYRKKRKFSSWKNKRNRYGDFVARVKAEEDLKNARQNFVNVLDAIVDKKSNEYWQKEKAVLEKLKQELEGLGKVPGIFSTIPVIEYCIKLFDIVSRAQDSLADGMVHVAPESKHDVVKQFNNDLYYSGRHNVNDLRNDSIYGKIPYWNTTMPGTPINEETIMFGPEIGLPRKPAKYWMTLSKKKKVYVKQTTSYSKGSITKSVPIWATDALVKISIHHFCKICSESLLKEVSELLS